MRLPTTAHPAMAILLLGGGGGAFRFAPDNLGGQGTAVPGDDIAPSVVRGTPTSCPLPSQGACTPVSWIQFEFSSRSTYSWGWRIVATTLNPLPGVAVDRTARIVTIRATEMGVSSRPPPVTSPATLFANGTLTYP